MPSSRTTARLAFLATASLVFALLLTSVALAAQWDFNADGKADILWRHTSGTVAVWLMDGPTFLSGGVPGTVPVDTTILGVGDFNGDTKSDILFRSASGDVSIWFMDDVNVASSGVVANVASDWQIARVGDFNEDGKADILWWNSNGDVQIWLMDGLTISQQGSLPNVPPVWAIRAVADFNGDGKADILWRNRTTGVVAVWLMDGLSLAGSAGLGPVPLTWSVAGVRDFNNDAKADILWRKGDGGLALWLMNGASIASVGPLGSASTAWTTADARDFSGDSKSDILWRQDTGTVSVWTMDGFTLTAFAVPGTVPTDWTIVRELQAPEITSADVATFTVGQAGTFTVVAPGVPPPTIVQGGTRPAGVNFVDNGNGTATLSGTPDAGTAGTHPLDFTASNGISTDAVQNPFTLTVVKQSQTISFTSSPPGGATVGGPTYNVTATATSGLAVAFTIDASATSVCSISGGSTVSFTAVGTCVINANQAGDGTYDPAPQVQQSFAVGQGSQTINFTSSPPAQPTAGGPTYDVTATATSGLTVTFAIDGSATSVCSIVGSTVSFIANGTCVINANQAGNANYSAAPQVQQSFAVKSNQTISFTSSPPATPTVGGATYLVTATATSGLPVSFTIDASASTVCSVVGSTVSFGPDAGTCVINANQPGDANFYPAPQVQQSFGVKKAQTITFTSVAPNPAVYQGTAYIVTATATSGLAVTLTINASATTVCSLSGSTSGSSVSFIGTGICVIDANQGGNAEFYAAPQAQQSFAVVPNAVNDAYSALGNVLVDSSTGPGTPFSVAGNDVFPAGTTISAFDAASTQGGTVTMTTSGANLGRFTYNPPVGFTGSDTFTYTLSSNGQTRAATVTFTVSGKVWFINNTGGACSSNCNGRLTNPFVNTSNFQTDNTGAALKPQANDAIFVYGTGTDYSGSITLLNGQRLIGQGASGTLATLGNVTPQNGQALPTTGGTSPNLTSAGVVLTTGQNNFVHGLTLGNGTTALSGSAFGTLTVNDNVVINTTGQGIALTNGTFNATLNSVTSSGGTNNISLNTIAGTVTINAGALSGATGRAIDIDAGTASVTYPGTISNSGTGVRVANKTGSGTVTLSGGTKTLNTGANTAVTISGNSAGTIINFTNGGLDIDTTSGAGFSATGGGTVSVTTGANPNTINTGTGTALNVANTTIGASGLTFRSIAANGAANGIVLNTTGAGGLTVTGNAGSCTAATPTCTGGTIQSTVGADNSGTTPPGTGIVLNSVQGPVSLTRMRLNGNSNYGIRGTSVSGGFTLDNSLIDGTNGTNGNSPFNDSSIYFTNLTGAATISNTSISGGFHNNFKLVNTADTLNRLTFSSVIIGANSTTDGNDGIGIEGQSAAVVNVTVNQSTFTSARGDLFGMGHIGTGTADLIFTNNALSNNHPGIATGGGGVSLSSLGTATFSMNLDTNTFRDAVGHAVLIVKDDGTGTQNIKFNANTIGVIAVANSGSLEGSALKIQQVGDAAGTGTQNISITNSFFHQYNNDAILLQTGAGVVRDGNFNATVTGNTVSNAGNNPAIGLPVQGINLNGGVTPGDSFAICAQIGGAGALKNDLDSAAGPFGGGDFRLRQRQSTTVRLPGYGGAATDTVAVEAFVDGNNTVSGSGTATVNSPPGGGFVGGAACPTPP